MKKCIKCFIVIAILISNFSIAQISSRKIDKLVNEAMETFNVAGVAIGIVKDGKIIHNKGYGVKSIETNEPVNEHTNFGIASNTKAFTTAALAILVDESKLSWNDKVVDYIPEFRMYNEYVTQNFSIVDLLTHRSGLGLGAGDLMFWPEGGDFDIKDVLTNFQHFEPKSAFRTKFDYDNNLYIVAGEIISRISGLSWDNFIKTRILKTLNMDNSYSLVTNIDDRSNVAQPHSTETDTIKTISHYEQRKFGAAGGIYSNVDDMCNWLLVQLNEGRYGNGLEDTLFTRDSQKQMWKLHTILNADTSKRYNHHFYGYGLGWFLSDIRGNMLVFHGGYVPGMASRVIMIPDMDLGIVVLTNTDTGGAVHRTVTKTIIDKYLKLENYDWLDYYNERVKKYSSKGDSVSTTVWETVESSKELEIETDYYIGIYEDDWFGKVEIFMNDNQLWFKAYRSPKLNGPMNYYKANAFAIKWEYQDMNADAFAIFSLDEEGKAQSIKMKGISPNIDFSFDFQDLNLVRIKEE